MAQKLLEISHIRFQILIPSGRFSQKQTFLAIKISCKFFLIFDQAAYKVE